MADSPTQAILDEADRFADYVRKGKGKKKLYSKEDMMKCFANYFGEKLAKRKGKEKQAQGFMAALEKSKTAWNALFATKKVQDLLRTDIAKKIQKKRETLEDARLRTDTVFAYERAREFKKKVKQLTKKGLSEEDAGMQATDELDSFFPSDSAFKKVMDILTKVVTAIIIKTRTNVFRRYSVSKTNLKNYRKYKLPKKAKKNFPTRKAYYKKITKKPSAKRRR